MEDENCPVLLLKGAAERVWKMCSKIIIDVSKGNLYTIDTVYNIFRDIQCGNL